MGAPAIITLTGSEFVMYMPAVPEWEDIREITLRITIFAWVIGTSWIPYQLFMDIRQLITVNVAGRAPLWIKTFHGRGWHSAGNIISMALPHGAESFP